MVWVTGLLSAVTIKLSSSIDDVVWLAPFLTTNTSVTKRTENAIVYIGVCLIQTVCAMIIAQSGDRAISALYQGGERHWSTEKILTVGAGCLLAVYSVKLAHEWYTEEPDDEDDDEGAVMGEEDPAKCPNHGQYQQMREQSRPLSGDFDDPEANIEDLGLGGKNGTKPSDLDGTQIELESPRGGGTDHAVKPLIQPTTEDEGSRTRCQSGERSYRSRTEEEFELPVPDEHELIRQVSTKKEEQEIKKEAGRQQTLFVIAFLGSVDDLTLFVPMLVGKGFDIVQLMVGALTAATAIVILCIFIGLCRPVANFLSSIPLALIVGTFATLLLIKGFYME